MLSKIKEFYFSHKMIIGWAILLLLVLVLACNWCIYISAAAIPLVFMFFLTCSFGEIITTVFFFMAFSSVSPYFSGMLISAIVATTIKYAIDVKNKKEKLFKFPLIISGVLAILFSVVFYEVNMEGFYNWALSIGLLFGFYYAFVYYRQIEVFKCVHVLAFGMITAGILSGVILLFNIPGYKPVLFDGVYNRARFFMEHVNHLSMFALLVSAFLMYEITTLKFSSLKEYFTNKKALGLTAMLITVIVLGVFSLSKAFMLVIALMLVYFAILLIKKMKWHAFGLILPACVILVGIGFIFKDKVMILIDRFTAYFESTSLINQILTNRNVVWERYAKACFESPLKILFGVGMLSKDLGTGPHSVILHLLFRSGFVGLILIGVLIFSYFYSSKSKLKLSFENILPLAVWCLLSLEEMNLSDRFFLFVVLGIIIMIKQNTQINTQNIE